MNDNNTASQATNKTNSTLLQHKHGKPIKYIIILAIIITGFFFCSLLWKVGSLTDFNNQPINEYRLNILAYWVLTVVFGISEIMLIKLYKDTRNME